VVLLPVDLALAWGLWRTKFWAVVGWVAVVLLLQFIPFLLFTDYFATSARERMMLYGQLVTHAVLLGVFWVLLPRRKSS
jgi:heme/copper-type cytochrome/quinol oxidase subunit 4